MAETGAEKAQVTIQPAVRILAANLVISVDIDGIQQTFIFPHVCESVGKFQEALAMFGDGNTACQQGWQAVVNAWELYWKEQAQRRALRG